MLDATDQAILAALRANARLPWKELGAKVHLTGQAAADRVRRLEDIGIIQGYTIQIEEPPPPVIALITVFMKSTRHQEFQQFLRQQSEVQEAHRISGEGCYWLKAHLPSSAALTAFLDRLLPFGNYRVNLSLTDILAATPPDA